MPSSASAWQGSAHGRQVGHGQDRQDRGAAALQFTLRHPAVTAVVVGARTPAEITCDAAYRSLRLPDELFRVLGAV